MAPLAAPCALHDGPTTLPARHVCRTMFCRLWAVILDHWPGFVAAQGALEELMVSHHSRLASLRLIGWRRAGRGAPAQAAPHSRLRRLDLRACGRLATLELALPALTGLVLNDCIALEQLSLRCPALRRVPQKILAVASGPL